LTLSTVLPSGSASGYGATACPNDPLSVRRDFCRYEAPVTATSIVEIDRNSKSGRSVIVAGGIAGA